MQVQTTWLEGRIRDEFDKLRDFLRVEEQATLDAMKEESRKKHLLAEEKMKQLAEQTEALAREIERLQMEMKEDDMTFLMVRGSPSERRLGSGSGPAQSTGPVQQPFCDGGGPYWRALCMAEQGLGVETILPPPPPFTILAFLFVGWLSLYL